MPIPTIGTNAAAIDNTAPPTEARTPIPTPFSTLPGPRFSGSGMHCPQGRQHRLLQMVAIKKIVRVERDQAFSIGMRDVHAALLHAAYVEAPRVDELHDDH